MTESSAKCKVKDCYNDAVLGRYCIHHMYQPAPILPAEKTVKRQPVSYDYEGLNWNFIKLMAEIANYACTKYGSAEQYTNGRLEGQRSPINHIAEHMRAYMAREQHDKFGDLDHQLAAIAYNAMMEFYYLHHGGPTVPNAFYGGSATAE